MLKILEAFVSRISAASPDAPDEPELEAWFVVDFERGLVEVARPAYPALVR